MQTALTTLKPMRRTSYVVTQGTKQTPFTSYVAAYAFWRAVYWKTVGGFPVLTVN